MEKYHVERNDLFGGYDIYEKGRLVGSVPNEYDSTIDTVIDENHRDSVIKRISNLRKEDDDFAALKKELKSKKVNKNQYQDIMILILCLLVFIIYALISFFFR